MKKIAIIMTVVIGLSMTPARAADKPRLSYVDKQKEIERMCDRTNLIYTRWRGGIAVIPNGCIKRNGMWVMK